MEPLGMIGNESAENSAARRSRQVGLNHSDHREELEPQRHRGTEKTKAERRERKRGTETPLAVPLLSAFSLLCPCLLCASVSLWCKTPVTVARRRRPGSRRCRPPRWPRPPVPRTHVVPATPACRAAE